MKLTDVIKRPLITEKTTLLREGNRTVVFEVASNATKVDIKRAVEKLLGSQGRRRPHVDRPRQDEAPGAVRRPALGLEEGLREAPRGRESARVPRGSVGKRITTMPIRKYRPTSPGRRFQTVQTFDDITSTDVAQAADRAAAEVGRPEQPRRADVLVARRRPQAQLPGHRLQARQEEHPGQGVDGRVRPEPVGADRAADLRGRREALHPPAARSEGRRHDRRGR